MTSRQEQGFEEILTELEEILGALESQDLRLDEALALFERGVSRLRGANRLLNEARGTVEELISEASGELRTVTFEPEPGESEPDDA